MNTVGTDISGAPGASGSATSAGPTAPMAGRTALITGSTSGIGRATASALARAGARVAITGRELGRTEAVAADIRRDSGNPAVDAFAADLSTQAGIQALAAAILDRYPRLDVLVNNVGGFWATRHLTADGVEHTLAVNHLAPFLLTNLLLDRLVASAPARIVTVASAAHALGAIDFEDLNGERSWSGQRAYNQSKLANVLFTYELARRLAGTAVTANVLHPGVVRTRFGAEDPSRLSQFLVPFWRLFMKTPAEGAATSVLLASSPAVAGVTGRYFVAGRERASSEASRDRADAARLWRVSADLVGLPSVP